MKLAFRCRELEDELSDLLDDDGRMSDAAMIGLRCKRSPRRSASARELINEPIIVGDQPSKQPSLETTNILARKDQMKKESSSVDQSLPHNPHPTEALKPINQSKALGNKSAPPTVNYQYQPYPIGSYRAASVSASTAPVYEKPKCVPIYLSGVIDSIDPSQAVR